MEKTWMVGVPAHIYMRGVKGRVIFYRLEDFLCYTSLIYILSRKIGVKVISMSLMINHVHILIRTSTQTKMTRFVRILNSMFAIEYNKEYDRKGGRLFEYSYGWTQKPVAKTLRSCAAYINNNPVVGHLSTTALQYRWNLLAYYDNKYPFSKKLRKAYTSARMRRSMDFAKSIYNSERPLNYVVMRQMFSGLDSQKANQLTDYILSLYNPLDFKEISRLFGDVYSAIKSFDLNSGVEYDLPDDWTDYSLYRKALSQSLKFMGGKFKYVEKLNQNDKRRLSNTILGISGMTPRIAKRFMHL